LCLGLVGRITTAEEEQNLPGLGYTQTQNETENYELQEQDPYRIQPEPDLTEEQEEYFRRIRKEFLDPRSYE
jgi:hypothetical protein